MPSLLSPESRFPLGRALRETWSEGYRTPDALRDIQAGVVTALVALPLSMALAISTGVPPQYGLATAVVAGLVASLLGGSRVLVTGPTAAFVALLLPIVLKYGMGGLLTAGFMAGALLLLMGLMGLGKAVEYVPLPVITGFTSGVALVIASLQVKDFLGLPTAPAEHFLDRISGIVHALPALQPLELAVGVATLGLIIVIGQITRRIPAPILALTLVAGAVALLKYLRPEISIATIGSRFQYTDFSGSHPGIPRGLPGFAFPWNWNGAGPAFSLSASTLEAIAPSAVAVALLGATESLLAAAVSDGMIRKRHDPDAELIGLGISNLLCPFFGGIPATGAIARTATAVRYGARSPVAAFSHALVVLAIILALAPLAAWLPMASMAALLLVVAWNMAEARHFKAILRVGRWGDRLVLATCFLLTVFFDMTVGVTAGILLAALFLIRRLDEMGGGRLLTPGDGLPKGLSLPKETAVFQVSGTLLFGGASKSLLGLRSEVRSCRRVVLDLSPVASMDISGLRALEQVVEDLSLEGRQVVLAAASQSVLELLIRSELFSDPEHGLLVYGTLKAALDAPLPTPVQVEVVEPAVPAPAKTKVRAQAVPAPKKRRAGAAKKADAPKPVRSPKAPKART
jgi:SulP family sulfate permease